jgi:hypothetical protein
MWDALDTNEQRALARALGDDPVARFDGHAAAARVTLRMLRLAMSVEHVRVDLWGEVRGLLWVGPNQAGLRVEDPERFFELARNAVRADGSPVFRPDSMWLLRFFKHRAEWSLRETGAPAWGLQLYRRGATRQTDDEIVADVDRATLEGGVFGHVLDVMRPGADPAVGWRSLARRGQIREPPIESVEGEEG